MKLYLKIDLEDLESLENYDYVGIPKKNWGDTDIPSCAFIEVKDIKDVLEYYMTGGKNINYESTKRY